MEYGSLAVFILVMDDGGGNGGIDPTLDFFLGQKETRITFARDVQAKLGPPLRAAPLFRGRNSGGKRRPP